MRTDESNLAEGGPSGTDADVAQVVSEVLRQRAAGENVPDREVMAKHPHLMPRLETELAALRKIHLAYLASQKAGIPQRPLEVLDVDELNAPIELPDERASGVSARRSAVIAGYTILEELGCGGQGAVYKAIQQCTGRTVAIKVMLGGGLAGSRQRARFDREIAILARIDHPNIIGIIDRGCTDDGSSFFVMGFVDGVPLDQYLLESQNRPAPVNGVSIIRLWAKIARAVDEAHRSQIVHRDLKPSNILVDHRGEPHIMDFGLARLHADLSASPSLARTQTGQIVGSLPWASPEQVAGDAENMDARSDVYSLGVIFFQVLTGQFPYPVVGSAAQVLKNILTVMPPAPSRLLHGRVADRDVPIAPGAQRVESLCMVDAILLKALAKDPQKRYASAGALADDLDNLLSGRQTIAYRQATIERRKRPWRWIRVVILTVICTLAAMLPWIYPSKRSVPTTRVTLPTTRNTIDMRLVRLTPTVFEMGGKARDEGRGADERWHHVRLTKPVYMGLTEVTQAQYRAVMGTDPTEQRFRGENRPVQNISWGEAMEFCRRLGRLEQRTYRLPTEAEWEFACRAGSTEAFAGTGKLADMGWHQANSNGIIQPVGTKQPNTWGLYDMHGNVAEWCLDGYDPAYRVEEKLGVTVDPVGPDETSLRVVRGGDVVSPATKCRSGARHALDPQQRLPTVGFRVVWVEADALSTRP